MARILLKQLHLLKLYTSYTSSYVHTCLHISTTTPPHEPRAQKWLGPKAQLFLAFQEEPMVHLIMTSAVDTLCRWSWQVVMANVDSTNNPTPAPPQQQQQQQPPQPPQPAMEHLISTSTKVLRWDSKPKPGAQEPPGHVSSISFLDSPGHRGFRWGWWTKISLVLYERWGDLTHFEVHSRNLTNWYQELTFLKGVTSKNTIILGIRIYTKGYESRPI